MGHAHTAPDEDGKACQFFALKEGHQTNILGIDIDAVITRISNAYFKFTWEIGWAINRFNFLWIFDCTDMFAINPDVIVGFSAGSKVHGNPVCNFLYFYLGATGCGSRTPHDIAVHITASSQRGEESLVNAMNRLVQIPFENTMQLK